jgi:hypothetical protein
MHCLGKGLVEPIMVMPESIAGRTNPARYSSDPELDQHNSGCFRSFHALSDALPNAAASNEKLALIFVEFFAYASMLHDEVRSTPVTMTRLS